MIKRGILPLIVFICFSLLIFIGSCRFYNLIYIPNSYELTTKLSDYKIFRGPAVDLKAADNYEIYELATPLFTDYAEKQRLIKVPKGTAISYKDDKLPEFPDGTVLVKTFYYYNDKNNPDKGKKLIETRILLKEKDQWNVGTYVWNPEQTEAILQKEGSIQDISWIDEKGEARKIAYHIPAERECTSCHQAENKVLPIGPKFRNLNIPVKRNGEDINQLQYFKKAGIVGDINSDTITKLPDSLNPQTALDLRARAYLEMNCAHCHNLKGFAADTGLYFDYETTATYAKTTKKKEQIIKRLDAKNDSRMPRLGTTIVDKEGVELVKSYLNTLN